MDESGTIYTNDGKEFPRKFRKFGDICLTEKNERIFVCNICKSLSVTPSQFWKHQRDEHGIRDYQDTVDNPNFLEQPAAEKRRRDSSDSGSTICKKTRSSDKMPNGNEAGGEAATAMQRQFSAESDNEETMMTPLKIRNFMHDAEIKHTDSPLLQQALKEKPRTIAVAAPSSIQLIPRATQEQLYEALNSNSSEDNFNEFIFFCCPECGKRFQTDAQWKQHTAAAHNFFAPDQLNISLHKVNPDGSTIYKCDLCNVLLNKPNIAPLRRHKLTHMPFKSFCCRLCGTKIRHKSGIVHHMRTVHRKGREKRYNCGDCERSFYTEHQYKKHFKERPGGGSRCAGLQHNDDSRFTEEMDANNTADDSTGFHNAMSEDGNYDNSFGNPNESSAEEEYDASAFLVTEMTEEGDQDGLFVQNFNADIKEEPPENIDDTPDDYAELWQGDAALIAEEQIQRKAKASKHMNQIRLIRAGADYEPPPRYECAVCCQNCDSKEALKKHLQKHGKKMDCRLCGVKISSIKALRRHKDLNRCKALNASLAAVPTVTSQLDKPRQLGAAVNVAPPTVTSQLDKPRQLGATMKVAPPTVTSINNPRQLMVRVENEALDGHSVNSSADDNVELEYGTFSCEICPESYDTELQLSIHGGRKHGKTDCRLCGVKISTLGALRRHYDLNRCKALK